MGIICGLSQNQSQNQRSEVNVKKLPGQTSVGQDLLDCTQNWYIVMFYTSESPKKTSLRHCASLDAEGSLGNTYHWYIALPFPALQILVIINANELFLAVYDNQ